MRSRSKAHQKGAQRSCGLTPMCNGLFAGHVSALFNLAVCYMDGDGVPANAAKAVRFLLKAAEAGHKQSQYQVLITRTAPVPLSGLSS